MKMTESNVVEPAGRGRFAHYMLKEVYEQPDAIRATVARHVEDDRVFPGELSSIESALLTFKKVIIAASGSSRHAGLAGEIMIEDIADVPVDVEYASEYCYRSTHAAGDPVVMTISQSGETADTVAAQRKALDIGAATVAISNVEGATLAREANAQLLTYAGVERSVPATKSFTAQLTVLHLFALFLARKRGRMSGEVARRRVRSLLGVPDVLAECIPEWDAACGEFAHRFRQAKTFLFLGRGVHYAIAREGALKLKEISYAHAEGYPAGELKHGPYALVGEDYPVVVIATRDDQDPDSVLRYEKTLSNIEDVRVRGGSVVAVANRGDERVAGLASHTLFVPPAPELLLPIVEVVPLQLFAYHVAVARGCDVDNPRNLVKSVVTE
jgi:glucosamine--fructose-6-phosphate aminotransferase (isomerizing)